MTSDPAPAVNPVVSAPEPPDFYRRARHDFKAHIRHIKIFLQYIEKDGTEGEETPANLRKINECSQKIFCLTEKIFQYLEMRDRPVQIDSVDLENVLDTVLKELEANHTPDLDQITRQPLPTVPGDERRLLIVFREIIANAMLYRRQDQRAHLDITAATQKHGSHDYHVISFIDDGIGMDPEHIDNIFMPFERLVYADDYSGTGMGLATVCRVLDQLGGHLTVESAPHQGSTFSVWLKA